MNKRTPENWSSTLQKVGVSSIAALVWSDIFSEFFQGEVFSAGDKELPDFLSQIIHETRRLKALEEDLNYSRKRMMEVWKSRFPTLASTIGFSYNPKALAEKVYGGRYGNKSVGDGWKYRGSGLIHLTFLDNYEFTGRKLKLPLLTNPELLRVPSMVNLKVAHAWWEGKVPDTVMGDTKKVRQAVNGGTIGLDDTSSLYSQLKGLLL